MNIGVLLQVMSHSDSFFLSSLDSLSKSLVPQSNPILIYKIDSLSRSVSALQEKSASSSSPWIPFFTAIIGAAAVLMSQAVERSLKRTNDLKDKTLETFTKCELLLVQLKSLCRKLSSERNSMALWFHHHAVEESKTPVDKENSKLYYDRSLQHTTSAQNARTKIGKYLAVYYATASKFKLLSKQNIDLTTVKSLLINIAFEDAPDIKETLSPEDTNNDFYKNDQVLAANYLTLLAPLDVVNDAMETYCKTLN